MRTIQSRLVVFIKSFSFLCPTLLVASFALFYFVLNVFRGVIFGLDEAPIWLTFIFRGINFYYILETPTIYLLSIALVSALVGAFWIGFVIPKFPKLIWLQIIIVPWIAVILTGGVWGLIWSINQWPPDSFGSYEALMLFRRTDIENGLFNSWLSAIQSYPLNVLSYGVYCGLLFLSTKFFLRNDESKI
jgi:hypothetical protein